MPPSGVDYASEFLNGYAPEYVVILNCFVYVVNCKRIGIHVLPPKN